LSHGLEFGKYGASSITNNDQGGQSHLVKLQLPLNIMWYQGQGSVPIVYLLLVLVNFLPLPHRIPLICCWYCKIEITDQLKHPRNSVKHFTFNTVFFNDILAPRTCFITKTFVLTILGKLRQNPNLCSRRQQDIVAKIHRPIMALKTVRILLSLQFKFTETTV
jgi:hypothetical protein